MMKPTLFGYEFSVYSRIVRMVCHEKGVDFDWVEINPFSEPTANADKNPHPFGRVPVFEHDGFRLYETAAISRYIDDAFPGPRLQPAGPRQRARMAQIISVIDAYAYWPLVRQVFSQRVFAPRRGERTDESVVLQGLEQSKTVLAALENLAGGDTCLVGGRASLADFHLAAMIDYFAMVPEGAAMLAQYPKLAKWWSGMRRRASVVATTPL